MNDSTETMAELGKPNQSTGDNLQCERCGNEDAVFLACYAYKSGMNKWIGENCLAQFVKEMDGMPDGDRGLHISYVKTEDGEPS